MIMAKKEEQTGNDDVRLIIEGAEETAGQEKDGQETDGQQSEMRDSGDNAERLTKKLKQIRDTTSESDEASSTSMSLREVLGGDFLWALVRRQIWLIILVVVIVTAYVAVRYQCQQDAIDIAQLEKDLVDAKFESLSSSSNLTRMQRQSNVTQMLMKVDSTSALHHAEQPPYIIDVPEGN